jgi:23S rRNA pseudouridine2605 synthase
MRERLQKILAHAGVASRREAETIIASGRVAVNGRVVTELGSRADPSADRITLDGRQVRIEAERVYILLNKPAGYVTTMKDPQGRRVVNELLKGVRERVYPVGRLDYNTEGLLLMTNDGELANLLAHPRNEVEKEYMVRVRGGVLPDQMKRLSEGVELDDGVTAPAVVKLVRESENNTWLSIVIHEGRYRQVRRMCETVGLTVVRLKRTRYAFLETGDLKVAEFRNLSAAEVKRLYAICKS